VKYIRGDSGYTGEAVAENIWKINSKKTRLVPRVLTDEFSLIRAKQIKMINIGAMKNKIRK
jgi:hypothetical protein